MVSKSKIIFGFLLGWQVLNQTNFCYREMRWISDLERCEKIHKALDAVGRSRRETHFGCRVEDLQVGSPIDRAIYKAIGLGVVRVLVWREHPNTEFQLDSKEYKKANYPITRDEYVCGERFHMGK